MKGYNKYITLAFVFLFTGCYSVPNKDLLAWKVDITNTSYPPPYISSVKTQSLPRPTNNERIIDRNKYCYESCPISSSSENLEIKHNNYLLSYNTMTKYADWVAYKIELKNLAGPSRARIWKADPNIPSEVAIIPSDYKGANIACNYDRGHQAPSADFSNSEDWESLNYLSNITPQKAPLNQGAWAELENKIRDVAKRYEGTLYVLTGTYYNGKATCPLPNARLPNVIPNGYWKIITRVNGDNIQRAAFIFDQNTPKNSRYCSHIADIKDISGVTGISFSNLTQPGESSDLFDRLGCGR